MRSSGSEIPSHETPGKLCCWCECRNPEVHWACLAQLEWSGQTTGWGQERNGTTGVGVCLYSTRILAHTSSWVTFRGTVLNIKIIANLPTVLQQAVAIKLRLIFLPPPPLFPSFFSFVLCRAAYKCSWENNIMSGLRIYCGICFLPQEDFYISLQ